MALPLPQFLAQLGDSGLLTQADVSRILDALPEAERPKDGEQLARLLVKQKKLTAYQAQQIYSAKGKTLVLGNYVVLDKLGQGGMGMVLKAEHRRMKRTVALKVLTPAVTKTPEMASRFQREVEAAARLSHPNIVAAYDADEANGVHFLVMEYVAGSDLSSVVKTKGTLPVDQAVNCVLQAARGLECAHKQGVIHRDIKPANLLLDSKGTVKILDMGLARIEGDAGAQAELTSTGAVMGTIDYMAPEQARSTKTADARSDIYSLGITLWYLLVGRAAYDGQTLTERLLAHQSDPVPSLSQARRDVPGALDALFQKMVAKRPQDRYQSMTEVIAALEGCQQSGASPPSVSEAFGEDSHFQAFLRGIADTSGPSSKGQASKTGATSSRPGASTAVGDSLLTIAADTLGGRPDELTVTMTPASQTLGTLRAAPPWWRQRKGLFAFGGGGALLMLGVILITITSQEGMKTTIKAPEGIETEVEAAPGSKVKITQTGSPAVSEPTGLHGWPADAPKPAIAPFDAAQANRHQAEWAAYLKVPVEYTNSIGMKFRLIPPGEFTMGSTPEEIEAAVTDAGDDKHWQDCIKSEAPQHKVMLTQPIYLGVNEVTQAEYERIMGSNPSWFALLGMGKEAVAGLDTADHPVERVRWNDAAEFCAKLSQQEKFKPFYFRAGETITPLDGTGYRLPSEAEWEFACRAGTATKCWIGDKDEDLARTGWFATNAGERTHSAGELKANPFGLSDTNGNVLEWVQDSWDPLYYSEFSEKPAINPSGPLSAGSRRVLRGGGWHNPASSCRSSYRHAFHPYYCLNFIGFRVSLPVDAVRQQLVSAAKGGSLLEKSTSTQPLDLEEPSPGSVDFSISRLSPNSPGPTGGYARSLRD